MPTKVLDAIQAKESENITTFNAENPQDKLNLLEIQCSSIDKLSGLKGTEKLVETYNQRYIKLKTDFIPEEYTKLNADVANSTIEFLSIIDRAGEAVKNKSHNQIFMQFLKSDDKKTLAEGNSARWSETPTYKMSMESLKEHYTPDAVSLFTKAMEEGSKPMILTSTARQDVLKDADFQKFFNGFKYTSMLSESAGTPTTAIPGNTPVGGSTYTPDFRLDLLQILMRPGNFLDRLPIRRISANQNIFIPRVTPTSTQTFAFYGEGSASAETTLSMDNQVSKARRVQAIQSFTYELLFGNNEANIVSIVMQDLAYALDNLLNLKFVTGTGDTVVSPAQPEILGLYNQGIPVFPFASAAITWVNLYTIYNQLVTANAMFLGEANINWLFNNQIETLLGTTGKALNFYAPSNGWLYENGMIKGLPAISSNILPSSYTIGTRLSLEAAFIGDWSRIVWIDYSPEILIWDIYSKSDTGQKKVSLIKLVDVINRRPNSFVDFSYNFVTSNAAAQVAQAEINTKKVA